MESETLKALREQLAETQLSDIRDKVQPGSSPDAVEFQRWLTDRMLQDARIYARAARLEKGAA